MRRLHPAHRRCLPVALLVLALAGCGGDEQAAAGPEAADAPLPRPQRAGGSITEMPTRPGPGDVPLAGDAPAPAPTLLPADEHFGLPPLEDNPETGLVTPADPPLDAPAAAEPTAGDAVAALQAYYTAINARDFAQAYAAWSDGGRASGQTPEQFATGFADTVRVEVAPGAPGAVDAAAGSRYVEIPVSIAATHRDGSVHRYAGRYVLRRAVVDGATPEQRSWRIASAELRETPP